MLFVGINPGVRSALTGHHFAGHSNRFWKLLYDARLVPTPITCLDDDRLPEWGYGITNIVARPTPGMGDLSPADYRVGARVLLRKVRRYQPDIVALVGVTVYRALLVAAGVPGVRTSTVSLGFHDGNGNLGGLGMMPAGSRVFVLPNPSGRNANYSYAEMLEAFRTLRRGIGR